ncbi:GPR endopeptidase [Clostridium thermosuccinogenes]|uniref:Germination protease n=1 Tax=Clostridium thermosuccinogenes TaxID=84032 RepID=A0A2K2FL97_9CLOT|nr:GPR endopeptidase [Pseudoclostridium thermosuccinogenes]AUS96623.1 GPR endopeptidase [Pseudoclostridium thermosuccinogenes]PNT97538.1 GPR endopeptidase [Pseudoclostridium thermosuccinogenes]PNT99535.1 GPR endopeptidase [Pseudoclostridium thermosuccinogenes]
MIAGKSVRTDLAIEAHELIKENELKGSAQQVREPSGVEVENAGDDEIKITRVRVTSPAGEESIGKPMGNYITLEVPRLKENDQELYENTCKALAKELVNIINLRDDTTILIVGLGNWNVTPDSLGPKVVSSVMVTRHLLQYVPEQVDEGVRPVCAVAPGVLGITGIETGEIVRGIVDRVRPDLIIAIDALASRKMERVSTTIQIADTGIAPGSGVGNKRMELSRQTLGVPVIAIGVPMVVDAATMANDTIDLVLDSMIKQAPQDSQFYRTLKDMDREEKYSLIREILSPYIGNLIVTPKEIDELVDRVSKVIANGLNIALHQGITLNDVNRYVN